MDFCNDFAHSSPVFKDMGILVVSIKEGSIKKLTPLFLFYIMLQHFAIHSIEYKIPSAFFSPLPSSKKNYMEEGFGAHTCVATSSGARCINELTISDHVIDKNYKETEILGTHKGTTDRYIKLSVEDEVLCVGCKQRFYLLPNYVWVNAEDLKVGDQLVRYNDQPCTVHGVEIVHEQIFLYAFRGEQHAFLVTSYDLLAHNMDAVVVSASGVALEYISFANPVVAFVGATVALSVIAHRAYEKYTKQTKGGENKPSVQSQVRLAEKSYHEHKRVQLHNLRNEFFKIKQDLKNFCAFYGGEFVHFSQQILKHYMQHQAVYYTISISQEINLPEEQHTQIRKIREAELRALEKDIIDLQYTLGLHVNELIVELEKAVDYYYAKAESEINSEINVWNSQCNRNQITKAVALKSFEYSLLDEHLVNTIDQRIKELKLIANFYSNSCSNILYIKKSTNILSVLEDRKPIIAEYEKIVAKNRTRVAKNIAIAEDYFASHGIACAQLKNNIRNVLKAEQQNNNEQKVKDLANKRSGSQTPNGPKKDDDDKEDKGRIKFPENENDASHIFRNKENHIPKDTPEARKMLEDLVNDRCNYKGLDKHGTRWFSKILENGEQLWARVGSNNRIKNAGLNKIPKQYNPETGFCKPPRISTSK